MLRTDEDDSSIEKKRRKRIMREFALDEISAVTVPAQKGARMLIMKSADPAQDSQADAFAKLGMMLTSAVEGHAHLIEVTDRARAEGGGYSLPSGSGAGGSHSHPFVIGSDGTITIGMAEGHSHTIETAAAAAKIGEQHMSTDVYKAAREIGFGPGLVSKAVDELDHLAKARAEKTGESYYVAYDKVLQTREGRELFKQTTR